MVRTVTWAGKISDYLGPDALKKLEIFGLVWFDPGNMKVDPIILGSTCTKMQGLQAENGCI